MPRNLIVVVFDTLRYDAVATDLADTPNLDRFAAESAVFDNAWGEGLPTIPFRRALFTGMRSFPWNHKSPERGVFPHARGWQAIPEDQSTVAEYLYARGYVTQLVTDVWHMLKPTMNFTRGFVSWDAVRGQEGDTYRFGSPSLDGPEELDRSRVAPSAYLYQVQDRSTEDDYFVSQVFDRAGRFVDGIGDRSPYCLWVESFSPHEFWDPPMRFADAYHPPAASGLNYIVPGMLNGQEDPSADDIARTRALYQGYVTFCDERFGRFLDTLERSGALDDTVVAVVSDHGTELRDKGRFGKSGSRLHPYTTRINLMIRHPDGEGAGSRVDTFVQNHDIAPTLLKLLDVGHGRLDGQDIWPLVTTAAGTAAGTGDGAGDGAGPRPAPAHRDHVVIGWDRYASVRTGEWNLIVDTLEPAQHLRLFDLLADPDETTDVAPDHPDVVRDLTGRLEALLGAPLPARYQHTPIRGPEATPRGLQTVRTEQAASRANGAGSPVPPSGADPTVNAPSAEDCLPAGASRPTAGSTAKET